MNTDQVICYYTNSLCLHNANVALGVHCVESLYTTNLIDYGLVELQLNISVFFTLFVNYWMIINYCLI